MTMPTDFVVVLPGILGSTLRHDDHVVWAPSAGSAVRAINTFGRSLKRLRLPDDIGDEPPEDGVQPVGLMPDLHVLPGLWTPVKGYDRLLKRLRSLGYQEATADPDAPPGNLLPVAYDWRLSNRYNGRRLAGIVEPALERWRAQGGPYADAKITFVCHSMGGLVARWYIEHCGGHEITTRLITLGTPYRGSAKALEQLVNGARKGLGPLGVDLTDLVRSMPSMYHLLPEYACIEHAGDLAKTVETTLPELDTKRVVDGALFHRQLADAEAARPDSLDSTHAIVGIRQPTATTARLSGGRIELVDGYRGQDLFGDATVPLVAACRGDVWMDSPLLRRIPDRHGNLQRNRAALDEIEGILTARPIVIRAPGTVDLSVDMPDLILAGEDLAVGVATVDGSRQAVRITVTDEIGRMVDSRTPKPAPGGTVTTITDLPPGAHTVEVGGIAPGSPVSPVTGMVLVWG
ncbi:esterase/lipase family protein [Polymorphospora lycopeni]|uniref:Lecithin:cholesterol acyltransferase n=1 Tax=Polymorphospora lycopeni TaxID=3140240 RepID=A0ABV5CR11_9ACTN